MINVLLYKTLAFTIHGKYKKTKFKISAPTWNKEFELADGSYFVSEIQDYFEYIFKKHGKKTDNPSIRRYLNKIENRITFRIKTGYFLELLTPETTKLFRSTKTRKLKIKIVKMCLI